MQILQGSESNADNAQSQNEIDLASKNSIQIGGEINLLFATRFLNLAHRKSKYIDSIK